MKLGVSYNVFDGCELLEQSIKTILPYVDYINICWQEKSWYGHSIQDLDKRIIDSLNYKKLVYVPTGIAKSPFQAKTWEKEKRQMGLNDCRENGCTHFLGLDVDEFYLPEQFGYAKYKIIANDYDFTVCKLKDYFKSPCYQSLEFNTILVPFICKMPVDNIIGFSNFFTTVDVTRNFNSNNKKTYEFEPSEIFMHHMTGIRKNMNLKWQATSRANLKREKIEELSKKIDSMNDCNTTLNTDNIIGIASEQFKMVPNYFGIEV